jgi:hypothetical protein
MFVPYRGLLLDQSGNVASARALALQKCRLCGSRRFTVQMPKHIQLLLPLKVSRQARPGQAGPWLPAMWTVITREPCRRCSVLNVDHHC